MLAKTIKTLRSTVTKVINFSWETEFVPPPEVRIYKDNTLVVATDLLSLVTTWLADMLHEEGISGNFKLVIGDEVYFFRIKEDETFKPTLPIEL